MKTYAQPAPRRRIPAFYPVPLRARAERGKFQYPPQLLLVDGGKGQLTSAYRVLTELGLAADIPVASLAKRFEEVYLPGRSEPVEVPRGSEALFMLQRIRDESHRFAISYHRTLRNKSMTESVLDEVPGLGPTRKRRLILEAGGIAKLKKATAEELRAFSWLPDSVADGVWTAIHGTAPSTTSM